MAKQDAIQDGNQVFALLAHTGTAGTAETVRLVANSSGQLQTTASVSAPGTQTVGGAASSGAAAADKPVLIAGTDSGGTVYSPLVSSSGALLTTASLALNTGTLTTIAAGTQNTLGTVGVLNTGTLLSSGTTTGVGVVTSVTNLVGGTFNLGTVTGDIASGAADSGNPVKVGGRNNTTQPTLTDGQRGDLQLDVRGNLKTTLVNPATNTTANYQGDSTDAVGTTATTNKMVVVNRNTVYNGVSWDRQYGDTTGIFVGNVVKGTINALASGTITGGTLGNLNSGTVALNMTPVVVGTSLTTVGTTGAAVWGTLVAASGAGTKQYVSGVDIVVTSGTVDVAVTNIGVGGSIGAGVLARGQFPAGGGISKNFNPIQASGTNGTLSYWLGGAGTVAVTIQYWNGV